MTEDIESYWEDIRFYPPEPVNPIIQLRAEDMARKAIAEELGLNVENFIGYTFEDFVKVTRIIKEKREEASLIQDLHERPAMLNEFEEAFRARRR